MPPLTEQAHAIIRQVIRPGDVAIDATAGNGHDTKFLAELVGETGHVFAIDLQQEALQRTAALLAKTTLTNIHLVQRDHAELKSIIPGEHHGRIATVMFNLGYLPGGNRSLATRTDSTLEAIRSALEIIRPGGVLTIIAYPGHPGGATEAIAVESLLRNLSPVDYETAKHSAASERALAPCLFVVKRRATTRPKS
ncbi:MAG: class I SAM-dependent methyltransferase [Candidatus Saccharimonas sp.]|nr:class I SAM-dependent methyltransferase [Planctomycetaceae bacterium]